ncbi:MAG: cysteine peptidase family C39 domain-containing protein [Nitrospinales bacterium]
MKPIVQIENTGCGLACAAMLAGISYSKVKIIAYELGITASDPGLWSDSTHIRKLCSQLNIKVSNQETPFKDWKHLPDCALLAIKWHKIKDIAFWHWTVFIRDQGEEYVLDPSPNLKNNRRTDFGRIKPRWFIKILS